MALGIFVLKETAKYYSQKSGRIYTCAIDASEAFDKVWRKGMFHKLINKIKFGCIRNLYNYYESQICYVELEGKRNNTFNTGSGVKQGGPLSPKLSKNLKVGAVVLNLEIDIIIYAEDIMLISPTKKGLEQMITEVKGYMELREIKINLDKTNFM
jgi:hypothetical protein